MEQLIKGPERFKNNRANVCKSNYCSINIKKNSKLRIWISYQSFGTGLLFHGDF